MNKAFKAALLSAAILASSQAQAGIFDDIGNWFKGIFEDGKEAVVDVAEDLIDVGEKGINYIDTGLGLVKGFVRGVANTSNDAIINHKDVDAYQNTWVARAWALQRDLSLHAPMAETNMIGTHNSYNAEVYTTATSYLDPQHKYSIYDQLRMGARFIELDAHWTVSNSGNPFKWKTKLLLCHSGIGKEIGDLDVGCSPHDRPLKAGFHEINNFLNEPQNQDEVVIVYIEDHSNNHHQEIYDELMEVMGDKVYKSGGCKGVPNDLSAADILAQNKQVIIRGHGCSDNANYRDTIFNSLAGIKKIAEDGTAVGAFSGAERITSDTVREAFRDDDVNLVNLDWMSPTDGRNEAGIWSWAKNEPNNSNNEDCAVQYANGRWNDTECSRELYFACQDSDNGDWALSYSAGRWEQGEAKCQELGPYYHFATPISSKENQQLLNERGGFDQVWLNYSDRAKEGEWLIADEAKVYNTAWRPLVNGRSHLCLDIKGGSNDNGAKVQQYNCHSNDNQLWRYDHETGFFKNKKGKCLDISGDDNNVRSDQRIQIWNCNSDARDQTWNLGDNQFKNRVNGNYVIDAYGVNSGDPVGLWSNHGGANQQWFWGKAKGQKTCPYHNATFDGANCRITTRISGVNYWYYHSGKGYYYSPSASEKSNRRCEHNNASFDGANCRIYSDLKGVNYWDYQNGRYYNPIINY